MIKPNNIPQGKKCNKMQGKMFSNIKITNDTVRLMQ